MATPQICSPFMAALCADIRCSSNERLSARNWTQLLPSVPWTKNAVIHREKQSGYRSKLVRRTPPCLLAGHVSHVIFQLQTSLYYDQYMESLDVSGKGLMTDSNFDLPQCSQEHSTCWCRCRPNPAAWLRLSLMNWAPQSSSSRIAQINLVLEWRSIINWGHHPTLRKQSKNDNMMESSSQTHRFNLYSP